MMARPTDDARRRFAEAVVARLGEGARAFLYWKGRVALYAILRAMGVGPGDEVVLPGFTCVVVPNAILYLGAKPVYVDVRRETCNVSVAAVRDAITERTKVILCQNTYGLSAEVEDLVALARQRGIYTVEDCAHGFGGTYKGRPNGSYCDAAFFSTQWNKPFSTGLGGFAVVNNPELAPAMEALEAEKARPSFRETQMLRLLLLTRKHLVNDFTYWPLVAAYRWLSKRNLVLGSSQGEELSGPVMPRGYFKGMSRLQAAVGLRALDGLDEALTLRRRNAEVYTQFLESRGKNHVSRGLFEDHGFLKYPLLVRSRPELMEAAADAHVSLGDWFVSPLHPVECDWGRWGLDESACPVAAGLARSVVNLPTDTAKPRKVVAFLETRPDLIEPDAETPRDADD